MLSESTHRTLAVARGGTLHAGWALAFALGVVAFLPSLRYPFLLDDWHLVQADPRIQAPLNWHELVWRPLWPAQLLPQPVWRPVFHISLALNRLATGEGPAGFRMVNLLLHGAVAALVWALARTLGAARGTATAAAVLFALHPVHTEAVVGIVGRAELQMTLGTLLTLVFGLSAIRTGHFVRLLGAAGAYAFALFSKEQGFLAIGLGALAWLGTLGNARQDAGSPELPKGGEGSRRRVTLLALLLLVVALIGMSMRLHVFGWEQSFRKENLEPLDNPLVEVESRWERTGTGLRMMGRAVALMLLPVHLSPDYSSPGVPVGWQPYTLTISSGLFLAILAVLIPVLWVRKRSRGRDSVPAGETAEIADGRLVALGLAWFLITELPVSNLLMLNGTIFGERQLYLPSVGACLVLGVGWSRGFEWMRRRWRERAQGGVISVRTLVLLGVAALLGWCWMSARPWRSALTLFDQAVQVVPRSSKAHYGLGLALKDEGERDAARREMVIAIGLWPRNAYAWHQLGILDLEDGQPAAAETNFREALRLEPRLAEAHNSLGNAMALQKNYREALREFEWYQRRGPRDPEALERKIQHTRDRLNLQ